jgi:hypothetical protein
VQVTLYGSSSRQQHDAAEMGVPGAASLLKAIRYQQLKQYFKATIQQSLLSHQLKEFAQNMCMFSSFEAFSFLCRFLEMRHRAVIGPLSSL